MLRALPEVQAEWNTSLGQAVRAALRASPLAIGSGVSDAGDATDATDDSFAAPVALWIAAQCKRSAERAPLFVGLNGPQGAGKSTLAARVARGLAAIGLRAAVVSVDDFYLTHAEQSALAARHPGDPTLEFRGYPGTHDVALGTATLTALAAREVGEVLVPRYDKTAHGGRGDRAPITAWQAALTPLDVVVFEGWMLGFQPVLDVPVHAPLHVPNGLLGSYAPWLERLDVFIQLVVASAADPSEALESEALDQIVAWRIDAERARRAAGAAALTDAEARDYIERFLPAYRLWGPGLAAAAPVSGPSLRIAIGPDRQPSRRPS